MQPTNQKKPKETKGNQSVTHGLPGPLQAGTRRPLKHSRGTSKDSGGGAELRCPLKSTSRNQTQRGNEEERDPSPAPPPPHHHHSVHHRLKGGGLIS